MQRPASGDHGMESVELASAAPSSTAPAAVIHERSGLGERKNGRTANVVWVSASSANQSSHVDHRAGSSSFHPIAWNRSSSSTAVGGVPARTASFATSSSRRENDV